MPTQTEIYLVSGATFVKVTDANGKVLKKESTSKGRELRTTNRGVLILPDDDGYLLNNFELIFDELVDKFGATKPDELEEALRNQNFFKKGGGGVSERPILDDAFYYDNNGVFIHTFFL